MADYSNIIYQLVVIFAGATIFATVFLYLKQPVMLAYIAFGMVAGPWGLGVIKTADHVIDIGPADHVISTQPTDPRSASG